MKTRQPLPACAGTAFNIVISLADPIRCGLSAALAAEIGWTRRPDATWAGYIVRLLPFRGRPRAPAQRDRRRGGSASPPHATAARPRSRVALSRSWPTSFDSFRLENGRGPLADARGRHGFRYAPEQQDAARSGRDLARRSRALPRSRPLSMQKRSEMI